MYTPIERVIPMKQISKTDDHMNKVRVSKIKNEILDMIFEMLISFVPITLYWLIFYMANKPVDYYEHIKNGSIIWIFLAMLVAGNFKIITNSPKPNKIIQKLIIMFTIILMLSLLGIYLILNFTIYQFMDITLEKNNTTYLVIGLGVATIILNILRITCFDSES